eukprot:TRINITY_DN14188_c0_g1_i1.p1 TRINITY_DN14188_c0_g1~~TRINITY_DN14188_c0_g1_i1.p1  ORF type:complete len:225 (+),score=46.00 TRINITY_DN14188_c0_g1_i1:75-749(+)
MYGAKEDEPTESTSKPDTETLKWKKLADEVVEKILAQLEPHGAEAKEWNFVKQENEVLVNIKPEKDSAQSWRFEGRIKAPQQDVLDLIIDPERRVEYDPLTIKFYIIKSIDENTHIAHLQSRTGSVFFSNRDFVFLLANRQLESGTWVLAVTSVTIPEMPEQPGFVRGYVKNTGWAIEASGSGTFCTFVCNIDPKGWIPNWLVQWVRATLSFQSFRLIRGIVEK